MNVRHLSHLALALVLVVAAAAVADSPVDEDALWQRATVFFKPLPEQAETPTNELTAAKVELGKKLYFDQRLSKDGNISCNSCHNLASYGVDNLSTSPGDAGEHGARNSPTVLNAAFHVAQFWDGRAEDVEEQAGMPILNPVEMAIPKEEFLIERIADVPEYEDLFARAFPDQAAPMTYDNLRQSIGAFERTLVTPSPFDRYLQGDREALTPVQKAGLQNFFDLSCTSCHNGTTVGGHIFRKFGLNQGYWEQTGSKAIDEGRFTQTGDEEDRYVFKVPSLRNIGETYPYFHDGSVADLENTIRVMARVQVNLELDDEQVATIAAFLRSMTGEVPTEALPVTTTGP